MKRMRPEFNGDIAYLTSNTIVAMDGFSQRSHRPFMAKMKLMWFYLYPGSAVQELITMPNLAYLD